MKIILKLDQCRNKISFGMSFETSKSTNSKDRILYAVQTTDSMLHMFTGTFFYRHIPMSNFSS
jgi:hypothetical protein